MGKGTVKSEIGDGQYTIDIVRDTTRLATQITALSSRISTLATAITEAEAAEETAETAYKNAPDDPVKKAAYDAAVINRKKLVLQKAGAEKQKEYLEGVPETIETDAWCADLSEELSGDVGTIEVPGERGRVQIVPGYDGAAVYAADTDGMLQPAIAGTPANIFYNWALQAGWQKWKPTYRYGTITALYTSLDTCDITLDAAVSSQQSLSINQTDTLSSVPIIYMDCNSLAFEIGDHVVIEFDGQSWDSPQVIGFYDNPAPCGTHIQFRVNGENCQKRKVGWLYHPDYGHSTAAYSDETGLFDTSDFTIPGGDLDDYYLEVHRENYDSDLGASGEDWLKHHYQIDDVFLLPTDGDQDTECASADNLRTYDYILCGSEVSTTVSFTLDDLDSDERRTVQLYNQYDGCTVTINTIYSFTGGIGIELYWNGSAWVKTGLGYFDDGDFKRLTHYIRYYSPIWSVTSDFPFKTIRADTISYDMYGIGTNDFIYVTEVKYFRSEDTIGEMEISSGRLIVDAEVKQIQKTVNTIVIDHEEACNCVDPVYTSESTVTVNRSTGSFPNSISSDVDSDSGGCDDTYGYLVGYSLLVHSADTATLNGIAILSDMYGREPDFTGFTVDGYMYIRNGWVVDSGYSGGDETLCENDDGYGNGEEIPGYLATFEAVDMAVGEF